MEIRFNCLIDLTHPDYFERSLTMFFIEPNEKVVSEYRKKAEALGITLEEYLLISILGKLITIDRNTTSYD